MFMQVQSLERAPEVLDSVSVFDGVLASAWRRGVFSDQVEFTTIQQLPLHFLPRLQSNRCRQRNGKVDVEFGVLPFGSDRLHF